MSQDKQKSQKVVPATTFLQNHLLIAMPSMADPNLHRSVIYLCEHNLNGAVGVMINRPTTITLMDVLSDMKVSVQDDAVTHMPVLFGGPVHQERGFVIHNPQGNWRSTLVASDDIFITTSRDILEALAVHQGPKDVLVALGCMAWEPGQLEKELADNTWLSVIATPKLIFDTPFELRYTAAAASLGVDFAYLSDEVGHA